MSILWMDSMQQYADVDTAANLLRRWQSSTSSVKYLTTGGPFDDGRWQIFNDFHYARFYGDWNKTTLFYGGWFYQGDTGAGDPFIDFWEGDAVTCHVQIDQTGSVGVFDVRRGESGTVIGTTPVLWKEDQWNFAEFKVVIADATSGSVVINVNGVEAYSLTGVDTRNAGTNGWIDAIRMGGQDGGGTQFSHLAVWDNAGDAPTDFIGPYRIYYLKPNADGTPNDFTPQGAGDNFAEVDEQNADDDTTYNESSTVTDADELGCEDIATNVGTIYAVQATVLARKDDAGARGVKVGVDSNGTDDVSADQALLTAYAHYEHILSLNPDDAAVWEEADINALKLRYEVGS